MLTNLAVWYLRNPIYPNLSPKILRRLGADVGQRTRIKRSLRIDNAITDQTSTGDFTHLSIGSNCYIGDGVYLDLADCVDIRDDVTVSGDVSFLTHADCNRSPWLAERYPREQGSVTVGEGCWIGYGAIILAGVSIGRESVVGAGSVVTEDVDSRTVVGGVPAEYKGNVEEEITDENCAPGEHNWGFRGTGASWACVECGTPKTVSETG